METNYKKTIYKEITEDEVNNEKVTYKLDELNNLPESPGIYFMKDKEDRLLYVGKSKCLKKRVKSYFLNDKNRSRKIERMIKNISHIEIIKTDTEFDALFLECQNIHKLKPMYNTLLKSYEKYKYICLDERDHNIIKITNEIEEDGIYFGPYSFKRKLDIIKKIIIKVYHLPICKRQSKCIRYDLNKCIAPCRRQIDDNIKHDIVKNIKDNLNGKSNFVIESLKKEMNTKVKDLKFEEAAKIHEEIDLFSSIVRKQKYLKNLNRDIVFWINMKNYRYKVYYINCGKIKYEKVIDARYPSQIEKLKTSIQDFILQNKEEKDALRKDEIDYINIINEYIKDTKDRGYIEIRKGE
ncbi:MAG: GIY-YIG nuclease family protein [Intestinibacter bartlettii]|uniref:GIY-YIG nuclease family protein n=1 Tax=Intestinibacter bartlettii TaxID=261299 RepID=UPI0026EDAFBC|nr:GIY-YIG nuclease family protein [Intestinibacter bartlettii]MDO5010611.1 GIY-YIG nuclease family protein [Intestinibacter bartlettii]